MCKGAVGDTEFSLRSFTNVPAIPSLFQQLSDSGRVVDSASSLSFLSHGVPQAPSFVPNSLVNPDKKRKMKYSTLPSFLYANIRSTLNKIDEMYLTISNGGYHVFAATETWLHSGIAPNLVRFPNYISFRCDRLARVGGGVCVWTHFSLRVLRLDPKNQPEFLEAVWLSFPTSKLIFVCIYIPPDASVSKVSVIEDYIVTNADHFLTICSNFSLIICGDLNQFKLSHIVESLDLVNCVKEPTRGLAFLDCVLVSESLSEEYIVEVCAPVANSDHRSIRAKPSLSPKNEASFFKQLFDLRQSNIDRFMCRLSQVDWRHFYKSECDLDEKCEFFHRTIELLVKECIPSMMVEMKERDKPWVTPLVKSVIQRRWNAYRQKDFAAFQHWKCKAKELIIKAKQHWSTKAQRNPSSFWKLVGSVTSSKSGSSIYPLINQFQSIEEATNTINQKFTSVFSNEANQRDLVHHLDANFDSSGMVPWSVDISSSLVHSLLVRIDSTKAMGSDGVPSILYKKGADFLAEPLTHIFCLSVSQQKFPKRWKISHVCPVPKCLPPQIDNLRPISLLPLPSKILERIILKSVHSHFVNRFGVNQFGSRPQSSTACAIISLLHYALSQLELANVTGVQIVTYDYSKAFDTLSHSLIVRRLHEESFPLGFIQWVKCYLIDRFQAVRIGATVSTQEMVKSGVPQGSVLGPLLFCLVVSDLKPVNDDKTIFVKYVDDTTMCSPLFRNSPNDHVVEEHRNILEWSSKNGFRVNLDKCKSITFRKTRNIDPIHLDGVSSVKRLRFLGITINERLSWKSHVEEVCRIASQRIYGLRVLKKLNVSNEKLIQTYNAVVRSILEYASPALGELPSVLNIKFEKVQRRCHRLICGLEPGSECPCGKFEVLHSRREKATLKLFCKALSSDHVLHSLIPKRSSRSSRLIQPQSVFSRFRYSFVPHATFLMNYIPATSSTNI